MADTDLERMLSAVRAVAPKNTARKFTHYQPKQYPMPWIKRRLTERGELYNITSVADFSGIAVIDPTRVAFAIDANHGTASWDIRANLSNISAPPERIAYLMGAGKIGFVAVCGTMPEGCYHGITAHLRGLNVAIALQFGTPIDVRVIEPGDTMRLHFTGGNTAHRVFVRGERLDFGEVAR